MIEVNTYKTDYSPTPHRKITLDPDTLTEVQIRPNEIAFVIKKKFPNGDTETKVTVFKNQHVFEQMN